MALFGRGDAVGIAFQGKDEVTPVVRGIKNTMDRFRRDAATGFGIGAGISVWNTFTQGVRMAVDLAGDAVNAWAEEEASIAKLTTALEENAAGWDGNISAVEAVIAGRERLAFADDEQRTSLARLVATTKDSEEALRLQGVAMDFARLRNIDLGTASDIVGKVWSGNVGILSRYGIQLEKGATATEALAEVQARAQGQAEAYAETTQGRLAASQIALNNAMEKVGEVLAPIALGMAEFAADVLPDVANAIVNVADAFHNLWRFMNPGLALLEDTEKAIRDIATQRGLDADAAIAQFRAQNQANASAERLVEVERQLANMGLTGAKAGEVYSQGLLEERDALIAVRDGTVKVTQAQGGLQVSAEASAAAVAFLDKNLDKLPSNVSVAVTTPGADAAIADARTLLAIYGQLPTAPRFSDAIPRRAGVGRASGGPVSEGGTYLVGERGPELLHMGGGSGRITPNHAIGGRMAVYLDRRRVGWVIDEELGRRYAYAGEAGAYRRAD